MSERATYCCSMKHFFFSSVFRYLISLPSCYCAFVVFFFGTFLLFASMYSLLLFFFPFFSLDFFFFFSSFFLPSLLPAPAFRFTSIGLLVYFRPPFSFLCNHRWQPFCGFLFPLVLIFSWLLPRRRFLFFYPPCSSIIPAPPSVWRIVLLGVVPVFRASPRSSPLLFRIVSSPLRLPLPLSVIFFRVSSSVSFFPCPLGLLGSLFWDFPFSCSLMPFLRCSLLLSWATYTLLRSRSLPGVHIFLLLLFFRCSMLFSLFAPACRSFRHASTLPHQLNSPTLIGAGALLFPFNLATFLRGLVDRFAAAFLLGTVLRCAPLPLLWLPFLISCSSAGFFLTRCPAHPFSLLAPRHTHGLCCPLCTRHLVLFSSVSARFLLDTAIELSQPLLSSSSSLVLLFFFRVIFPALTLPLTHWASHSAALMVGFIILFWHNPRGFWENFGLTPLFVLTFLMLLRLFAFYFFLIFLLFSSFERKSPLSTLIIPLQPHKTPGYSQLKRLPKQIFCPITTQNGFSKIHLIMNKTSLVIWMNRCERSEFVNGIWECVRLSTYIGTTSISIATKNDPISIYRIW